MLPQGAGRGRQLREVLRLADVAPAENETVIPVAEEVPGHGLVRLAQPLDHLRVGVRDVEPRRPRHPDQRGDPIPVRLWR